MLEINPGLIIWTVITFIFLLVILRKFAWKPLLHALETREENIRKSIERAETAVQDAEQLLAQNKKHLAEAEEKSQKLIREGHELGEKLKSEIVTTAHQQSRQLVEQAKLEIEREKEAALTRLRSEIADLAIRVAGKIINENLDEHRHKKIVDNFLDEMPKN